MYIRYSDKSRDEFGIWKVSKDLETQLVIYYSDGSELYDEKPRPLDDALDPAFLNQSEVDILTRAEVEDLIFVEKI